MKLLDTSKAMDHLRGYGSATELREELVRSHESVVASELTYFELLAGTRPDEHDRLASFFSMIGRLPVSEGIPRRAGEFARTYRRSYSGLGVVGYLLAGTVSAVGTWSPRNASQIHSQIIVCVPVTTQFVVLSTQTTIMGVGNASWASS